MHGPLREKNMSDRVTGILYILLAVFLESVGHIWLKQAAEGSLVKKSALGMLLKSTRSKKSVMGISCFVLEFGCWTLALQRLDVSLAYQLSCLSFISVAILSRIFLGEQINRKRWAGILLILAGSVMVGVS
jgi:multidrug transporter EmrE-like cation transporter